MNLQYSKLSEDDWVAWLRRSKPRPILALGDGRSASDNDWDAWCMAAPVLAGMWSDRTHGAYAHLAYGQEWVKFDVRGNASKEQYYVIPEEYEFASDRLAGHIAHGLGPSGTPTLNVSREELVLSAIAQGQLNADWVWPGVKSPLVPMVRHAWESILRNSASEQHAVLRVMAALKRDFYAERLVDADALRESERGEMMRVMEALMAKGKRR